MPKTLKLYIFGDSMFSKFRMNSRTSSENYILCKQTELMTRHNGMVGFSLELSESDVEDIRQFVIDRNKYARSIGDTSRTSR